jgi:hypothetical protein
VKIWRKYIIDELPNYIVGNNKEIVLVERQRLDIIENEVAYQLSGDVSDDEVVSIGEKIGAKLVVTGSITQTGDTLRLNIKVIDVKTARLVGSNSYDVIIDNKVRVLLSDKGQPALPVVAETPPKRNNNSFSGGSYIGYVFSPIAPFGFSIGRFETNRVGFYNDMEFSFPAFNGYNSTSSTYDRRGIVDSDDEVYVYQDESTSFVWEEILGINGVFLMWYSLGIGFDYTVEYLLFQMYGTGTTNAIGSPEWYKPDSEAEQFDFLLQAGFHFKLSRLLLSLKAKYIFNRGANFDLGIGIIFNIPK